MDRLDQAFERSTYSKRFIPPKNAHRPKISAGAETDAKDRMLRAIAFMVGREVLFDGQSEEMTWNAQKSFEHDRTW